MKSKYGFIIDTNSYSGNFEREMCAFMTGHIGECGTGRKQRESFLEENEEIEGIIDVADENGCYRPVEICTTPNVWNNGLGFHYADGEEEIALQKYKEYVKQDKEQWIIIVEGHRGKNLPTWTEKAIDSTIRRYNEEISHAFLLTEPHKYPAYQSVLIHFESIPTEETIEFLKTRAFAFAEGYDHGLKINGFRLLEENTTESIAKL